jgi:hypothetical protein
MVNPAKQPVRPIIEPTSPAGREHHIISPLYRANRAEAARAARAAVVSAYPAASTTDQWVVRNPGDGLAEILRSELETPIQTLNQEKTALGYRKLKQITLEKKKITTIENTGNKWSGRGDLNSRPLAPQASALAGLRYAPNHWRSEPTLFSPGINP